MSEIPSNETNPQTGDIVRRIDAALLESNTEEALNELKKDIGCLSPKAIAEIRRHVEARKITTETRVKLDELLKECAPSTKEHVSETKKPSFEGLFEGTKSEMLTKETIAQIKGGIDEFFGELLKNATEEEKENIRMSMIDRLLQDTTFKKLIDGDMTVATIFESILKKSVSNMKKDAEKAEKTAEANGNAPKGKKIEEQITDCLVRVMNPLKEKLQADKAISPAMKKLLGNPKLIASYNGGDVSMDVSEMKKEDIQVYFNSLHGNILALDQKIVPLEEIRERGMDFISGSSFLQEIFKWLLGLPFIGNMIAERLGYSDAKEALANSDEEFRQRNGLIALRTFGNSTASNGSMEKGENSGKIKLLAGKDLSNLRRNKLADFFLFTKKEGLDVTEETFWMDIFNKRKLSGKLEGTIKTEYTLPEITENDLENNFKWLYGKLNGLLAMREEKEREERRKQPVGKTALAASAPTPTSSDTEAPKGKSESLISGIESLRAVTKIPASEQGKIFMGEGEWTGAENLSEETKKELTFLNELFKNPDIKRVVRLEKSRQNINNSPIITLKDVLAARFAIITVLRNPSTTTVAEKVSTPTTKETQTASNTATEKKEQDRWLLVMTALKGAEKLPFTLTNGEVVNFTDGKLHIGNQKFLLKVGNSIGEKEVTNISLDSESVILEYTVFSKNTTKLPKFTKDAAGEQTVWFDEKIWDILALTNGTHATFRDKNGGKLIVTRVA